MTEKRWTSGPWEWIGTSIEAPSGDVLSVETKCMAYCYGGYPVQEIAEADKALITTAPDMADALEAAEAALAAMRASHGMHGPCRHNDCADCDAAYNRASSALATVRTALARARGEGAP